jgi:tRNA wybutosine-synthesizing protein 2
MSPYLAVVVPKEEAEKVRKIAEKTGAKDKNRLIVQRGNFVEIPVVEGSEHLFKSYQLIEQKTPVFVRKKNLYTILKDRLPRHLHQYIPRSYKIVGDIALVKIHDKLEVYSNLIGEAIMEIHPRLKSVWRDLGREGMLRTPKVQLIAGNGSETVHKENGCLFRIDVTKVMFSTGNQGEKMRIVKLVREGEIIVDMFAGIGYFSIPLAVHTKAKKIYAIEINPISFQFLLENIKLNRVNNIVPILGDSMLVTPEGVADRVIMGHLFCHQFLKVAIKALKDEGGIIHYHESTPEAVLDRPVERVKEACKKVGKSCEILRVKKVKNYSPGVYHMVVDFRVH